MPIRKYPTPVGEARQVASGPAFPANPSEGDVFYRTDLNSYFTYNGASWDEWEIETHVAEHQSGGADELNVGGLAGDLADAQDPKAHVTSHQDGGADEIGLRGLSQIPQELIELVWNRVGVVNAGPLSDFGPWGKSAANPILDLGAASAWDDNHVRQPSIVRVGDTWYLFYAGHDGTTYRIGYASGTDLTALTKSAANPILDLGAASVWDDNSVYAPSVIRVGDTWYVFYEGHDGSNWRIGYASGTDLAALTKSAANPILDLGAASAWDDNYVYQPSVVRVGDTWYLFYAGHDGTNNRIGYASGTDLSALTKSAANPILDLGAASVWDDNGVYAPSVIRVGDTWYVFYAGHDGTNWRIGYASGTDLAALSKSAANPILDLGAASVWDDNHVYQPSVIRVGDTWYLFYAGHDGTTNRIGYADLPIAI